MKNKNTNIKIKMTLYGWFTFKVYLPFMGALGLYTLLSNMFDDVKNNIQKYFVIKGITIDKERK